MDMEKGLLAIMDDYLIEKNRQFKENQLAGFLRNNIVNIIKEEVPELKDERYIVQGSPGRGNWAEIPWICIFNKHITTSAQRGIYLVFLFSSDMERVYLSLNQGYTYYKENNLLDDVEEISKKIRNKIPKRYKKNLLGHINLKAENELGIGYEKTNILSKSYTREDLKSNFISVSNDIRIFLKIYDYIYLIMKEEGLESFYEDLIGKELEYDSNIPIIKESINPNAMIDHIDEYIESKGFIFDREDIGNFYLSIKTKPFVLMAGISGTGKSKMIQLFSEAIGANSENGRYRLISVKPDWNDGTDLFGYIDINGIFRPGILTEILYEANKDENLNKPYIVCLDEMNLARVEYYLSEYLSIIETRSRLGNEIKTEDVFPMNYIDEESKYRNIYFSDNIYIVGTVNMDDTTFSFSEKVLDRANTIEFSKVNLSFLDFHEREVYSKKLGNENFKTSYITIKEAVLENKAYVEIINNKLIEINSILEKYNRHFAYRVRDEIVFYILENHNHNILDENTALDYQIMQKILPRINGSDVEIKLLLIELHNYLNPQNQIVDSMGYIEDINIEESIYPKTTRKINEMLRSYENGYVSFWQY